jgi:hypothetical protein
VIAGAAAYGWSFLVARGRRTGYRTLLVPDFLAQSNEYGALSQAANGDFPAADTFRVSTVTGLAAGDITLAYRNERLTRALVGEPISSGAGRPPEDLLIDQHGRPLDLLYGFVCRAPGLLRVDAADFTPAHEEALRVYRLFLADETGFRPESSRAYALRSTVSSQPEPATAPPPPPPSQPPVLSPPVRRPPIRRPPRSPARWLVALAGLALVVISGVAWFAILGRGDNGPVTDVYVEKPAASPVDCDSPVRFRGRIKTNGPATVVYHWESDTGTTGSARYQVVFTKAAEKWVENPVRLRGTSGQQLEGTQTLVIDRPNALKDTGDYKLTCK